MISSHISGVTAFFQTFCICPGNESFRCICPRNPSLQRYIQAESKGCKICIKIASRQSRSRAIIIAADHHYCRRSSPSPPIFIMPPPPEKCRCLRPPRGYLVPFFLLPKRRQIKKCPNRPRDLHAAANASSRRVIFLLNKEFVSSRQPFRSPYSFRKNLQFFLFTYSTLLPTSLMR